MAEHRGAEIKTEGDSFYIVFDSPSSAVLCGLRILELAAGSQAAGGEPIPVGIGVHAGETVATTEGFVGSAVNVAARVCGQARAGELLVSDSVRSLTRTYLDVGFQPLGRRRLKGISEPIGLYWVTAGRAPASVPAWRRLVGDPRVLAGVAAIPLILLVAFVIVAMLRADGALPVADGSTSPGATTPPATGSIAVAPSPSAEAGFPTADEAALVELIPAQYRESCARADPDERPILAIAPPGEEPPPGEPRIVRTVVAAGIDCDLGGIAAPDRVWYWEVIPNQPLDGDNAQGALAAHGGIVGATPGVCRQGAPAIETWSFGGTSGRLVCYETDEGDAVLLWVLDNAQPSRRRCAMIGT